MDGLRNGGGAVTGVFALMGRGWQAGTARLDAALLRLASRKHRLIGVAALRVVIGFATLLYCLSDYSRRRFLWGPDSYNSISTARAELPRWGFSIFLWSRSTLWFEIAYHAVIVVALAFMIFGGRALTLAQALMMWSLHNRNQDVLEGGDNLARSSSCSWSSPSPTPTSRPAPSGGARGCARADDLHRAARPHRLIVFQTAVLYFTAAGRSPGRCGRTAWRCTTSPDHRLPRCRPRTRT